MRRRKKKTLWIWIARRTHAHGIDRTRSLAVTNMVSRSSVRPVSDFGTRRCHIKIYRNNSLSPLYDVFAGARVRSLLPRLHASQSNNPVSMRRTATALRGPESVLWISCGVTMRAPAIKCDVNRDVARNGRLQETMFDATNSIPLSDFDLDISNHIETKTKNSYG